jgi:hypothetical protein
VGLKGFPIGNGPVRPSAALSGLTVVNSSGSARTSPRWIWASCSFYQQVASGGASGAQHAAFRGKTRIAGGRWLALAPVYLAASWYPTRAPFGSSLDFPKHTICGALELSNGTEPTSWTSSNVGGQIRAVRWGGADELMVAGGMLVIGDPIYASDFSLPWFEFPNRALLPWERFGVSKASAGDLLPTVDLSQNYNAPMNTRNKSEANFAAVKATIMGANGGTSGGAGQFNASDGADRAGFLGWVGIPLDGQRATMETGTSIKQGTGDGGSILPGVDPAGNTPRNYDLIGYPCRWAQALTKSAPCLNISIGASSLSSLWGQTHNDWANPSDHALSAELIVKLSPYFDYFGLHDPNNEPDVPNHLVACENAIRSIRQASPGIKIFSVRLPNGGADSAGNTSAYNAATLDPRYANLDALFAAKKIDYQLDLRSGGSNEFVVTADIESGVTTALGTTTTLVDTSKNWLRNFFVGSQVSIGGVPKVITSNTSTTLSFSALGSAVASGTPYSILGHTTGDRTHPNAHGIRVLANNFESEQMRVGMNIPSFPRTK